jgi:glycosyltransferase involved in cell wall biosynthesis
MTASALSTTVRAPDTSLVPSRPLHVVMIDEELPYPPLSGKRIRTLNLTERLARRHRLTYVAHRNADAQEARIAAAHFSRLGIRTVVVDRQVPPKAGPGFYARLATNLLSPLPYSVATHSSHEMSAALARLAASEAIDLWHCEWTPYAHALRGLPGRRVVMAHNVESVIWQRYHETETNPLKRWYIGRQWRKFQRFERQSLAAADLTIAVSAVDAERFRRDLGVGRLGIVDNGVDTSWFRPTDAFREPATLLFLGSLEWRPNIDGVTQLLERIFPAIRREEPDARLLLVGRNPSEALRAAATRTPNVELHANVPDVRPFLARAGLMVVPLRIGGGSRLKILEALASGTPVVSTRVGAEGLNLEAGRHLDVVNDVGDMAGAIVQAIRDPLTAREQAENGRWQVLRLYEWDALADQLEQLWLRTVDGSLPPLSHAGELPS